MISDIFTIMWKEMKELLLQRGRMRGGTLGLLFFILVFGVFLPLQSGRDWVSSPINLIYWAWLPFLLVSSVIADSFAGERERNTLETLLASRLSDRAILFGKIAAAICYGWGLTLISILVGLITVNLAHGQGQLLLYSPEIAAGILALSFLISWLASGLGVLVSLRAATVRQAQQTFSIAFLLVFVPFFIFPLLPNSLKAQLVQTFMRVNINQLVAWVVALLFLLNLALLALTLARFQRARLILD